MIDAAADDPGRRPTDDRLEIRPATTADARRFYERNGFVAEAFGDGTGNEERQPDVRYTWHPASVGRGTRAL